MAFVIKKISRRHGKEKKLHYLVQNYRDERRLVKRETLIKLGDCESVAEFLEHTRQQEKEILERLCDIKTKFENFKKHGIAPILWGSSPNRIYKKFVWWVKHGEDELEECKSKIKVIKGYM